LGLAAKPFHSFRVGHLLTVKNFDRYRVPNQHTTGAIDNPHTTLSKSRFEVVLLIQRSPGQRI